MGTLTIATVSLIPRSFPPPVSDRLQYTGGGNSLGTRLSHRDTPYIVTVQLWFPNSTNATSCKATDPHPGPHMPFSAPFQPSSIQLLLQLYCVHLYLIQFGGNWYPIGTLQPNSTQPNSSSYYKSTNY